MKWWRRRRDDDVDEVEVGEDWETVLEAALADGWDELEDVDVDDCSHPIRVMSGACAVCGVTLPPEG